MPAIESHQDGQGGRIWFFEATWCFLLEMLPVLLLRLMMMTLMRMRKQMIAKMMKMWHLEWTGSVEICFDALLCSRWCHHRGCWYLT